MLMTNFMTLVDISIVNVALPSIRSDLALGDTAIQWIAAGFVIALALGLLPMGRLGDIFGRKRIFLFGIVCFSVASLLCGLAPNGGFLIAARVFQGAATAIMIPQTLAICQDLFDPDERGSAFALFGLVASLAAVSGPAIGGAIIGADLMGAGWRPIFLINIPIALIALGLGIRNIPNIPGRRHLGLDWIGTILAVAAMFCLIFPIVEGRALDWPNWVYLQLAAAGCFFLAFGYWEARQERLNRPQLMPMSLIAFPPYALGMTMTTTFFSAIPAFFFAFTLLLQEGFGMTPLRAGLTTMPFPIGIFAASAVATRLGSRWSWMRIFAGNAGFVAAMLAIHQLLGSTEGPLASKVFLLPLVLAGFSFGSLIAPLFQTTLSNIPNESAGSASGALQAMQHAGGAIGISAIGLLFFGGLATNGNNVTAYANAMQTAMLYPITCASIVFCLSLIASRLRRSA